jgi:RNA polymerase sigma-B factor
VLPRQQRADRTADCFRRARDTSDESERQRLWGDIVCLNMPVARQVARRFRRRGIADDDLEQVAYLALVTAVHRFDDTRDNDFLAYAVPSITGGIKRHFRDSGWMVRPPRRIIGLKIHIARAREELTNTLGRSPRPSEVAARLNVPPDEVEEALATDGCFTPLSLDLPVGADNPSTLADLLVTTTEAGYAAAEARTVLGPLVRRLPERDRHVLALRFVVQCSQRQIADELGISQVQVSRLLARICARLRAQMTA